MFIVATANSLSWIMTAEQLGELLQSMFLPFRMSPVLTLIMVALLLLVLGALMEVSAILVLMSPVLAPVAAQSGIDPIHFGLVFLLATMIGLVTPPVGMTMFITCSIADVTTAQFARVAWRPIVALILSLATCIVWPGLVLAIPNLVMGR
jgi:C4-dicarboxylate transporter DctM subunit